jgi:plastocyanin
MDAMTRPGRINSFFAFGCALVALLLFAPAAKAGVNGQCPPIADKPGAIPHVDYPGIQHLTYCYGPVNIAPGQNIIQFQPAVDTIGNKLWPQQDGYITRFDPELIYTNGSVPPVDVVHLHHGVWAVNGQPQFAAGEEKTIQQLPQGFGWPSHPGDSWILNTMLHDLRAQASQVYVVWRIDFVPSTPAPAILPVHTQWMDVAGNPSIYPVFDALRSDGHNGTYTFPDQAPASDRQPCTGAGGEASWPAGAHGCLGAAQTWTPNHPVTLIGTAGHLHPGGLDTQLTDTRSGHTNTLFTSNAHYYEPAGAVSWDVAMGATPSDWRVQVPAGDHISVHATYDTSRADWYEVMGIMPIAVYDGTLPGDPNVKDAQASNIPQTNVLTHTHLAENDNHGGESTGVADPLSLPSAPVPGNNVLIQGFAFDAGQNGLTVPTIQPGQSLNFQNNDAVPSINAFHTITACKDPCTGKTGVAYPIADGPVSFDSGELGYNGNQGSFPGAPALDRNTWKTPADLPAGTYTYFCRIHPFMRGTFRIEKQPTPIQTLKAKKKQKLRQAAVIVKVDKAATVYLQAKVKGEGAGPAGNRGIFSDALDSRRSKVVVSAGVNKKIKLRFRPAALKKLKRAAPGKRWKVRITSTVTDAFGNTTSGKTGFTIIG